MLSRTRCPFRTSAPYCMDLVLGEVLGVKAHITGLEVSPKGRRQLLVGLSLNFGV